MSASWLSNLAGTAWPSLSFNVPTKRHRLTSNATVPRSVAFPDANGTVLLDTSPGKYVSAPFGDDASVSQVITHNLGSRDVLFTLRQDFGDYRDVTAAYEIQYTDLNNITVLSEVPFPAGGLVAIVKL